MSEPANRVVAAAAAAVAAAEPEPFMCLPLKMADNLWEMQSKNGYTAIQTIYEIMDNAISIKIGATKVNFQIDWVRGIAYIEDNGCGFPVDSEDLRRALEFASKNPSDLNEHGCGLKAALAVLDPSNRRWRIVFKVAGLIYEIRAPYTDKLQVHRIGEWPGQMNERPHGAYIEFPINKKRFAELYATRKAKCENPDPYIEQELAKVWMLNERVSSGAICLHLNGRQIEPLRINSFRDYQDRDKAGPSTHKMHAMSTGAKVDIYQYMLSESIPNSCFKKTGNATGYYLFKNGRFIQSITGGARYAQLYGAEKHQSHIGFIAIINLTGSQTQLPFTSPTKIEFPESDLRSELDEIIKAHVVVQAPIEQSEETLVRKFINMRKNNFSDDFPGYKIEEKVKVPFSVEGHAETLTPQFDIVEEKGNKVLVYEAKNDNAIAFPAVRQLYGNYKVACMVFEGKRIVPVLILSVSDRLALPTWLAPHLVAWDNMPLVVMNYEGRVLFGTP